MVFFFPRLVTRREAPPQLGPASGDGYQPGRRLALFCNAFLPLKRTGRPKKDGSGDRTAHLRDAGVGFPPYRRYGCGLAGRGRFYFSHPPGAAASLVPSPLGAHTLCFLCHGWPPGAGRFPGYYPLQRADNSLGEGGRTVYFTLLYFGIWVIFWLIFQSKPK